MKAARLVVLGVAVAAGGVAAFMASHSRQPEAPAKPAVAPLATVEVLIARSDLSRGQVIEFHDVVWATWPQSSANGNFIKRPQRPDAINQFVGAIVRVPISAGQPIYDPMVVMAKGSGFLAAVLPKGMRAISMTISPESAAGGFILPEDHVDVMLTRHDRAAEKVSGTEKIVTDTILRNVRVLAVDQAVEEKAGQKVVVGKTVTLEVTPAQAEMIALSAMQGSMSLILRSLIDSQSTPPEGGVARREESGEINTVRYGVSAITTTAR